MNKYALESVLLNKFVLTILVLMILLAFTTITGIPTVNTTSPGLDPL